MSKDMRLVRTASSLGEWETVAFPVRAALAPYVRHVTGWWERTAFTRRREVPTPIAVLIINIGNRLNVNERGAGSPFDSFHAFFAGLHASHVVTESTGGVGGGIQVDFTPLGAYLFTGIPAHELANRVLHAEDVLGNEGRVLVDRLECTPEWEGRFDLVERFVLARMARAQRASEGIAWAWSRLAAAQGLVPIAHLRAELGWTPHQLIDGFRREIGLPPKQMARILRFQHAIDLLEPESASLAAVAAECGYYDQAHFAREFRDLAGCTPAQHRTRLIPESGGVLDEEPGLGVEVLR